MLFGEVPFAKTDQALFATLPGETDDVRVNSWVEYCSPTKTWTVPKEDVRNILRCPNGD